MANIEIDGLQYQVNTEANLLSTCHSLGLDLPYFCWHPALDSIGACRQCAVIQYRDASDTRGRLVMACMTPVTDAMRVAINAEQARQFRSDNIELLMTNHPHDCPVCEEGGECHLQDMTLMTGHTNRRYRGLKRTHNNQDLGPFINHEMNRCIACYRCIRYYDDYAGGKDLQVLGISHNVYFGRFEDGPLENEFSGNLVEVCPTGVFTDKTFSAHYARKWDLQTVPSVCVHCSVGCNISPGERYGVLRRVSNRYNGEVNGYFLCDRGRFGYGFVNSSARIKTASLNGETIDTPAAINHLQHLLHSAQQPCIGIGSPRASLEANFALCALVGEANFYLGLNDTEHTLLETIAQLLTQGGIHTPSLKEIEQADAILILGEDLTHSAPRLALAVRQASRNAVLAQAQKLKIPLWQDASIRELGQHQHSPVYIASLCATRLDDIATHCQYGDPNSIARLAFAIAHALNAQAPQSSGLSAEESNLAATIASTLQAALRPLIITGTSCASLSVLQAAYNVAKALPATNKQLAFVLPESNSLGLALIGGKRLNQALGQVAEGNADTVIILENDLYRRAAPTAVDALMHNAKHVVVIDSLPHSSTVQVELRLPAATFAESEGTLVSQEGRTQRYFPVFPVSAEIQSSWQWLLAAMPETSWQHCDDLTAACAKAIPALANIIHAAPDATFRIKGLKIPRQAHRASGRTALLANIKVSEPQQTVDSETPFAFSMEGAMADVPPAFEPMFWAPGWNSNQAVNKFQAEIGGHLRGGDAGVRLLEANGASPWFAAKTVASRPVSGEWRVVLLQHIFGSEELSSQSPPIVERIPAAYALLNPADATGLGVIDGDLLTIQSLFDSSQFSLPVKVEKTLCAGLIGLPAGFQETLAIAQMNSVKLSKAESVPQNDSAAQGSAGEIV